MTPTEIKDVILMLEALEEISEAATRNMEMYYSRSGTVYADMAWAKDTIGKAREVLQKLNWDKDVLYAH